jgi:hypothetical protein
MKRILSILAVLGALTFFAGTAEAGHCGGGYSGGGGGYYSGGFGTSFYGGRSLHRHRSFSPYDFGHGRSLYHNHGRRRSGIYFGFGF